MTEPCDEVVEQIVKYLKRHAEHGEVVVALDVVPDTIRFDCQDFNCAETLQIRYT
jgi:hypothetical protein